jgi:hypothetical protein
MPEVLYYTPLQIKLIKAGVVGLMSITLFQALTIRQLSKEFARGQERFDNLREGANYLLGVLQENNVDLTDFDVIALTDIFEGSTTSA